MPRQDFDKESWPFSGAETAGSPDSGLEILPDSGVEKVPVFNAGFTENLDQVLFARVGGLGLRMGSGSLPVRGFLSVFL